jgi:hypothetical protein
VATAEPELGESPPAHIQGKKTPVREAAGEDPFEAMGSTTRPSVPGRVHEFILPNNLTLSEAYETVGETAPGEAKVLGLVYRPALLAQASIRFLQRKYNLDYEMVRTAYVEDPDRRGAVRWENYATTNIDPSLLVETPAPRARFGALEAPLSDAKTMRTLERDFVDWAYRESTVTVRANEALDVFAGPEVSSGEFRQICAEAAREKRDEELDKVGDKFEKKIDSLEAKIAREQRELAEDRDELSQRKMEELGTHAENVLSLFSKRRRTLTTSLTKRRMTQKAKADVEESLDAIEDFQEQMKELEEELAEAIEEVKERWGEIANEVEEISVQPYKKDVIVDLFGVAWTPYHVVQEGDEILELPGYSGK